MPTSDETADLKRAALEDHEQPRPAKVSATPTKQRVNQRGLALAYSPGVAAAAEAVAGDPATRPNVLAWQRRALSIEAPNRWRRDVRRVRAHRILLWAMPSHSMDCRGVAQVGCCPPPHFRASQ
jgi:hypothetical protein